MANTYRNTTHTLANPELFRGVGYAAVAAALVLFLLFVSNVRSRVYYHGPNYSFLGCMSLYAAVAGYGLIRLRKWSVILLSVPTAIAGLFLILGSVLKVPFPWALINIFFGMALCAPAIFGSFCWPYLS